MSPASEFLNSEHFPLEKWFYWNKKKVVVGTANCRASTTLHVQTLPEVSPFMECSTHRAHSSLHDCLKSCLWGVQVSRGFLLADLLSEQCRVICQAQDVSVAEGGCAIVWKTWVLQICWRHRNERFLQEWTKTFKWELADHLVALRV